ncbi:MAG TPA: DUF4115 domain-containing protein [bacterium]|nr:DUF4115 domain-containing protein [bacterium]
MDTLNELLKSAREAKGVTVADVSDKTKLRVRIIEALEAGDFKSIGAPAYLKGFVKIYTDYLGLDTALVIAQFKELFEEPKNSLMGLNDKGGRKQEVSGPGVQVNPQIVVLVIGLLLALGIVAGAVFGVVKLVHIIKERGAHRKAAVSLGGRASPNKSPVKVRPDSPTIAADIKLPAGKRAKMPAQYGLATVAESIVVEEDLTLTADVKDNVWMRVKADDQLVFEDTLKSGDKESWKAKKGFSLKLGNAGGVTLLLNNIPVKDIGKSGEVKTLEIGQEDLKRLKKQ